MLWPNTQKIEGKTLYTSGFQAHHLPKHCPEQELNSSISEPQESLKKCTSKLDV